MKRVSSLSPHRALRSLAAFCPPGRIPLKTALCVFLAAVAGISSPTLRAQTTTAHFSGVQITLPISTSYIYPLGVAVDGSGNVYIADDDSDTVLKETPSGGSYIVSTIPTSNLSCPSGVAVDGSGNIYIADQCNNQVLKETLSGGSYTESTVVTGLYSPQGVAVDRSGNVYIADTRHQRVLMETPASGGGYTETVVTQTGLSYPEGVAVDGSGNVYIADTNNYRVLMETPASGGGYTETVVTQTGSLYPRGVAVDGNGNVYVADAWYDRVLKETFTAVGSYSESTVPTTSDIYPVGVAVDGSGNVYVADDSYDRVLKTELTPSFGSVNVGSHGLTASMIFTIDNAGTLGTPAVVTQGATGQDFADAGTGTCTLNGASYSYNSGETCTVDMTFTPKSPGVRYGGAVLTAGLTNGVGASSPASAALSAAVLTNSVGAVIATGEIPGIGVAPQVNFLPGTQSVLGLLQGQSGVLPGAMTIDAAGNLYVADGGNNQVLKLPPTGAVTTVANSATNGLNIPAGVAVDGSGNVFISDPSNNRVLMETFSQGGYIQTVLGSGLSSPQGVAVDGNGNVYIADSGNGQIVEETPSGGTYTQSVVANGLSSPMGVAVDGSGNVYVADTGNNRVVEEVLSGGTYTQNVLFSGLSQPQGLSVDGMGNVYISDTSNNRVLAETLAGGSYTQTVLGSGLNLPAATTVDGSGNVYIADTHNHRLVKLDVSDAPDLAFAPIAPGSTSSDSPQTVTVANVGNAPLSIVVPADGNNPSIAANFILNSSGDKACPVVTASSSAAGTLAAGTSCQLPISFSPTAVGSFSGSLVLTDNNLNAIAPAYVSQSIMLSGTGTQLVPTLTFATIATQAEGAAPFAVSATSASSGAVTYAVLVGPATISDNMVTVTGVGTVVLTASQAASGSYAAATATTTFAVGLPFTLAATTAGGSGTSASVTAGSAASFSFTLTPAAGTTFPNAITFTATGLPTGATATFSPATIAAGSAATPVTLTIQTAKAQTARNEQPISGNNPLAPVALGFLLLPLLGMKAARRRLRQMPRLLAVLLAVGLSLGALLGISGCSGGSVTTTALAQSYTVVVTATDATTKVQSSMNLTLTVQ